MLSSFGVEIKTENKLTARETAKKDDDTTKTQDKGKKKNQPAQKTTAPVKIDPTLIDSNWYLPHTNSLVWNETRSLLYFGMKPITERFTEKKDEQKFKKESFYDFDTLMKRAEVLV
jgi:hypothetical protein